MHLLNQMVQLLGEASERGDFVVGKIRSLGAPIEMNRARITIEDGAIERRGDAVAKAGGLEEISVKGYIR